MFVLFIDVILAITRTIFKMIIGICITCSFLLFIYKDILKAYKILNVRQHLSIVHNLYCIYCSMDVDLLIYFTVDL